MGGLIMKNLIYAAVLVLVIVTAPFVTIWTLNTLFSLTIAYTWKTWLAAFLITGLFAPRVNVNKN